MPEESWNSAEVRFIDREQVIRDLRQAVAAAKARYPEIIGVFLLGSLVEGNWTADSDADLIVVVRRDFSDILERSPYQIFTNSIPTDLLVDGESEFEKIARDSESFPAQNLPRVLQL